MSNETNDNYEWIRNTLDRFINYLFIPRKYKFPGTLVLVGGSLVGPEEPLIVSILRFITPQGMERIGFSAMNSYDSLGVSLIIIGTMLGIWHFLAEFIKPVKRILLQYSYDRISNGGIKNLIDPNSECWKPVFRHDFRDVSKVGGEKTLGKTKKILKKIKSSQEYYYCGIAHLPIVAFTRMLAGPIDFTPGVFDIELPTKENNRVSTTIAQQLALYVVIYSPVQMACDLPENYENQPAFQFIRDVGVDWDRTEVLNGEVGDYVTIARKERGTGNWFVGGITDENARELTVDFDFLDETSSYKAIIYKDAESANFRTDPTAIDIENIEVNKNSSLNIKLAEGGGFAISLLKENE